MTTLAFCNKTKLLGADTRMGFPNYVVHSNKIVFPKKGIVLASAGNAGEGEWLRHKLSKLEDIYGLYTLSADEKPKLSDTFAAFVWWKKPWLINDDLFPVPIEGDYWAEGTGGDFALAYLHMGLPMHEAIMRATKIDHNSGPPIHVVDCGKTTMKISIYDDKALHEKPYEPTDIPADTITVIPEN